MCKYCKDFTSYNEILIEGELDLRGIIEALVIVRVIDDKLSVDVFPSYGDEYFFEGEVKINYCPMCGRRIEAK